MQKYHSRELKNAFYSPLIRQHSGRFQIATRSQGSESFYTFTVSYTSVHSQTLQDWSCNTWNFDNSSCNYRLVKSLFLATRCSKFYPVLRFMIILVNSMVIIVYYLSPELRKNYIYYFKLNITLADLLVGVNCLLVVYIEMKISSFEQIPG